MIGPRIGIRIGPSIGPRIGIGTDPLGAAGNVIVLGPADSNGVGQGIGQPATLDSEFDPAFAVMAPIVAVAYNKHFAQSSNDPVPYLTDITGGVGPYDVAGVQNSGFQVPFAQEMLRAGFPFSLWEHDISGIAAKQWTPLANFPTLPGGGPNLWTQTTTRMDTLGGKVRGQILVIGGNDGNNTTDAGNCQANLTAIVNASIAKWGAALALAMVRNSANQAAAVTFLATIQAAQDAVAAAFPSNIVEIWTDDLKLHSDNLHFNGNSLVVLGQRIAYALLDKMGIARFRPTTPQIVGWGPLYTAAGVAYNVVGPGCAINGDIEVCSVWSGTAGGTNSPIVTPTTTGAQPWTLQGAGASATAGGSTMRMAVFTRPVTTADMVTGNGAMPPTTIPVTTPTVNAVNGARIVVVRGASAVDVIQYSNNAAFGTALTLTGVTTGFANEGIVAIAGGYRTNVNPNPVTMAPLGAITGLTSMVQSNRTVVSDFVTHAAFQAALAASGSSGDINVTFGLGTLACGAVIGFKP